MYKTLHRTRSTSKTTSRTMVQSSNPFQSCSRSTLCTHFNFLGTTSSWLLGLRHTRHYLPSPVWSWLVPKWLWIGSGFGCRKPSQKESLMPPWSLVLQRPNFSTRAYLHKSLQKERSARKQMGNKRRFSRPGTKSSLESELQQKWALKRRYCRTKAVKRKKFPLK